MARSTQTARSPKSPGGNTPAVDVADAPAAAPLDPALASTNLVTRPASALAGYVAPEDYTGFEDQTAADIKVPFLSVLQSNSPQVLPGNPKQIKGAQASMFLDSLTGEVFDGMAGFPIIPVMRIREEQEWVPRNKGGGLVARHDPDDQKIKALRKRYPFQKAPIGDGNELVETVKLYVHYQHPVSGEWRPAILVFSSTNMGVFQTFYTLASAQRFPVLDAEGRPVLDGNGDPQQATYPMFAHVWHLRTKYASKGEQSWYKMDMTQEGESWDAARLPRTSKPYREAHALFNLIRQGRVIEDDAATDTQPIDEVQEL